jgi:hypothetical protein
MAQPQISVFGHSFKVSTAFVKTESEINILFTHSRLRTYSELKSIRILSGMKLMPTTVNCTVEKASLNNLDIN